MKTGFKFTSPSSHCIIGTYCILIIMFKPRLVSVCFTLLSWTQSLTSIYFPLSMVTLCSCWVLYFFLLNAFSWGAPFSVKLEYIFMMSASNWGARFNDLFEITLLLYTGHSLLPRLRAVTIQFLQNQWKQVVVIMVFFIASMQIGHLMLFHSSLLEATVSNFLEVAFWDVSCNSCKLYSNVSLTSCTAFIWTACDIVVSDKSWGSSLLRLGWTWDFALFSFDSSIENWASAYPTILECFIYVKTYKDWK